jgi:hypothetical protein
MKKIIVIIISAALLLFVGYRAYQNYQVKKAAMNMKVPEKIVPVRTGKVSRQQIVNKIKSSGNIQPDSEITLY